MDPTLDGSYIFGTACHVVHEPHPVEFQKDAFPGINGVAALGLGGRGRTFMVTGLLIGPDLFTVISAEAALLSFADGVTHTFMDTQGRAWPNVIFEGHYRPHPEGPRPLADDSGWCLPFQCTLTGLS
jgi:hypothetical protein